MTPCTHHDGYLQLGRTPHELAKSAGLEEVVQLLMPSKMGNPGVSMPLSDDMDTLTGPFNWDKVRQGDELRSAAEEGRIVDVRGLLNAKADVNAADQVTVLPCRGVACLQKHWRLLVVMVMSCHMVSYIPVVALWLCVSEWQMYGWGRCLRAQI